jgi:hypothetical protein
MRRRPSAEIAVGNGRGTAGEVGIVADGAMAQAAGVMKVALTYGLVTALVSALWMLVEFFLGFHGENIASGQHFRWLPWLILLVGIVLAIRAQRAAGGGTLSYGRGVGTGVLTAIVWSLAVSVWSFIYTSAINPDFIEFMVQFQLDEMERKGMAPEMIDAAEKVIRMMSHPLLSAVMGVVTFGVFGTVVSLIAAAVFRTKEGAAPPVGV